MNDVMCYIHKKSKDIKLEDFATGYQMRYTVKGRGYTTQVPAVVSCTTVM